MIFQGASTIAPFPVSTERAGKIHARLGAQAQYILQRYDGHVGDRCQHRTDHDPVDFRIVAEVEVKIGAGEVVFFADILRSANAVASARARPPAYGRVVVVHAGVGNQFAIVIMRTKRWTLRIVAERELQQTHAGQTKLQPKFLHRRSDDA